MNCQTPWTLQELRGQEKENIPPDSLKRNSKRSQNWQEWDSDSSESGVSDKVRENTSREQCLQNIDDCLSNDCFC